uniref:Uncharacterized protein n=1 Tax=Micrurus paraensis TaxID=1970185 RepID=A0A2D4JWC7_9SAUR
MLAGVAWWGEKDTTFIHSFSNLHHMKGAAILKYVTPKDDTLRGELWQMQRATSSTNQRAAAREVHKWKAKFFKCSFQSFPTFKSETNHLAKMLGLHVALGQNTVSLVLVHCTNLSGQVRFIL